MDHTRGVGGGWRWAVACIAVATLATALFITRYDVADCPTGVVAPDRPGYTRIDHSGCYVLDRWTGKVTFRGPTGVR